ncbi:MAG: hypothetical protein U0Y82_08455 [Thermoleophilia bacterium]
MASTLPQVVKLHPLLLDLGPEKLVAEEMANGKGKFLRHFTRSRPGRPDGDHPSRAFKPKILHN